MTIETFGAHWDLYSHNRALLMKWAHFTHAEFNKHLDTKWSDVDAEHQQRLFDVRKTR